MPSTKQRIIDLLAMGRVANVPTVLCNTFTGCLLGAWFWGLLHADLHPDLELSLLFPLLSGACLYLGGCFLNDWHDSNWDRENRPERAIPSGRYQSRTVLTLATALLATGLILAGLTRVWALLPAAGIVASILVYTRIHKRTPLGIIPMGLCRGLLYALGFVAQTVPPSNAPPWFTAQQVRHYLLLDSLWATALVASLAFGLLAYIAGLSLAARFESKGKLIGNTKLLALLLLSTPLLAHTWMWIENHPVPTLWAAALFALVLLPIITIVRKKGLGLFVSALLAIIPLVDFLVLAPISDTMRSSPAFHPAIVLAAPFAAILSALALQRLAPAT